MAFAMYITKKSSEILCNLLDFFVIYIANVHVLLYFFPFKKVTGCQNINFQQNLLLVEKNFFKEWSKEKEIEIPNLEKHYEIVVFNTSEDYDIGGLSHVPNKLICFLI